MRWAPENYRGAGLFASSALLIALGAGSAVGDEPQGGSRLARLFRLGGPAPSSPAAASGHNHNHDHDDDQGASTKGGAIAAAPPTTYSSNAPTSRTSGPSTPSMATDGPAPRIAPQPRSSRPPTEADPVATRVAIGRSDTGGQFGMFLQVFADGTVIDLEGVHRVGGDLMKPLMDALRQGEVYRLKGHCGAPSTDFVEATHVVVYERSYGKLRANSFSYSGNPQGCDPSIKRLHAALEAIQARLSAPATVTTSAPTVTTAPLPTSAPVLSSPAGPPLRAPAGTPVLGLTPPDR